MWSPQQMRWPTWNKRSSGPQAGSSMSSASLWMRGVVAGCATGGWIACQDPTPNRVLCAVLLSIRNDPARLTAPRLAGSVLTGCGERQGRSGMCIHRRDRVYAVPTVRRQWPLGCGLTSCRQRHEVDQYGRPVPAQSASATPRTLGIPGWSAVRRVVGRSALGCGLMA